MKTKVKAHVKNWEPSAPLALPLQKNDRNGWYEGEVTFEEAIILVENLAMGGYGYQLFLETQSIDVDVYFCSDSTLEVEVFDERDGFSAIAAELDSAVTRKIIEMAFKNQSFSDFVPTTDKPWWTRTNV